MIQPNVFIHEVKRVGPFGDPTLVDPNLGDPGNSNFSDRTFSFFKET